MCWEKSWHMVIGKVSAMGLASRAAKNACEGAKHATVANKPMLSVFYQMFGWVASHRMHASEALQLLDDGIPTAAARSLDMSQNSAELAHTLEHAAVSSAPDKNGEAKTKVNVFSIRDSKPTPLCAMDAELDFEYNDDCSAVIEPQVALSSK